MSAVVDWKRYRKCHGCGALLGKPCVKLSGTVVNGRALDAAEVEIDRPHGGRKLRAGYGRG